MKWTAMVVGCGVAAGVCLSGVHEARAARIYNFLVTTVAAVGFPAQSVQLAPGQRSDSLSWAITTNLLVAVEADTSLGRFVRQVCYFDWFPHAEVQGGNYIVIAQLGKDVRCNLCNADHQLVGRSDGRLPEEYKDYRSPYQEC